MRGIRGDSESAVANYASRRSSPSAAAARLHLRAESAPARTRAAAFYRYRRPGPAGYWERNGREMEVVTMTDPILAAQGVRKVYRSIGSDVAAAMVDTIRV